MFVVASRRAGEQAIPRQEIAVKIYGFANSLSAVGGAMPRHGLRKVTKTNAFGKILLEREREEER